MLKVLRLLSLERKLVLTGSRRESICGKASHASIYCTAGSWLLDAALYIPMPRGILEPETLSLHVEAGLGFRASGLGFRV